MKPLILVALLAMSSFASCTPAFAQDDEDLSNQIEQNSLDQQYQQEEIQQQIEDQRVQADERQLEMQEQMKAQQDEIEQQREKMEEMEMDVGY